MKDPSGFTRRKGQQNVHLVYHADPLCCGFAAKSEVMQVKLQFTESIGMEEM